MSMRMAVLNNELRGQSEPPIQCGNSVSLILCGGIVTFLRNGQAHRAIVRASHFPANYFLVTSWQVRLSEWGSDVNFSLGSGGQNRVIIKTLPDTGKSDQYLLSRDQGG